jgi:hypothetical protein
MSGPIQVPTHPPLSACTACRPYVWPTPAEILRYISTMMDPAFASAIADRLMITVRASHLKGSTQPEGPFTLAGLSLPPSRVP